jgi:hypothetical protein
MTFNIADSLNNFNALRRAYLFEVPPSTGKSPKTLIPRKDLCYEIGGKSPREVMAWQVSIK